MLKLKSAMDIPTLLSEQVSCGEGRHESISATDDVPKQMFLCKDRLQLQRGLILYNVMQFDSMLYKCISNLRSCIWMLIDFILNGVNMY